MTLLEASHYYVLAEKQSKYRRDEEEKEANEKLLKLAPSIATLANEGKFAIVVESLSDATIALLFKKKFKVVPVKSNSFSGHPRYEISWSKPIDWDEAQLHK